MKLIAGFTVLSLFGAYYAPRTSGIRDLNWIDSFGTGDEEFDHKMVSHYKMEPMNDEDMATNGFTGFNKLESSVSSARDPVYIEIMNEVESKLETATNHAIDQLKAILMLDDSKKISVGLLEKIVDFRKKLVNDLEDDLFATVESFKSNRSSDGPLSDDERYEFIELLKAKWEETLAKDIEDFQKTSLPRWVSSVRDVWKGVEQKVLAKIEKFKVYIQRTSPRSGDMCALPSAVIVGTNAISSASKRFNRVDLSQGSAISIAGKVALFILAVTGVIVLALASPFFFYLLGVFWLVDWITEKVFDA